ncbi:MAG: ABC transporter ATP-binding protein [Desulfuromonadaceae bacterium]|nr:ABC transporter ATP-binding protein [Desulfuromonadaceae bacterium]
MSIPEIALNNVSKTYNPGLFKKKVQAVQDLTLEVGRGEVYGLIGPNGAGKSTTIRVLLGLIRPDGGEILFRGEPLRHGEFQKEIGYLPENPYLYDYLTLEEILQFCGRVSGCAAEDRRRRIDELTGKLQLDEALRRPLRAFSKGMLQRAGICFALLHDPSIVILDEPMSGLDPLGRKLVFDIVLELKEQGKTIFFCSHILSDVERLCDRMGVLVKGRLARTFARQDFAASQAAELHLLLPAADDNLRAELETLPGRLAAVAEGLLLSIPPSRLTETAAVLARLGVEIRGTRAERVSLEELFIATVEGGVS